MRYLAKFHQKQIPEEDYQLQSSPDTHKTQTGQSEAVGVLMRG